MIANESIPELAEGVAFSQLTKNSYLLSNSLHKHYVRINQDTYNLLSLIDGKTTLSEICTAFNQKYQKDISAKTVTELLQSKLAGYGVLKGFEGSIKPYQKPSYLKLSVKVIDEKAIAKIVRFFYFLFFKWVAVLITVASLCLIGSLLYLNFNLYQSFNLADSLLYMVLLMTASLMFHEIGHATSTSYFGAKYGGIGIGFYLLSPVFYADVTDVWRLPKTQRIIVNLAGVYFEMIFCTAILLVGVITHNNSIIIVSITIFIHTLFNLNPFLRSDGYWILSDLIGMPNLLNHSLKRIKDAVALFKGVPINWSKADWFLFLYGMINYICMGVFLYYVLLVNPDTILLFPARVTGIVTDMTHGKYTVSFETYLQLLISLTFFILAFRVIKPLVTKIFRRIFLLWKSRLSN
jgi:putative peptide zinc metalloprotease protein